jgi:hypothetical protein
MASFDNATSTPISVHNSGDDTTVTIDMGDDSCEYDYDIASFNSVTSSSLNSSATIKYSTEDRSLTIPKTVLKKVYWWCKILNGF